MTREEVIFLIVTCVILVLLITFFAISNCIYENRRIELEWKIMKRVREEQQRELLEILSKNK